VIRNGPKAITREGGAWQLRGNSVRI
jgi:hypothetical protein